MQPRLLRQQQQESYEQHQDAPSIVFSAKRRKPIPLSQRRPAACYEGRDPRIAKAKLGFIDYRTRLTNKICSMARPSVKLGIFNHFCTSNPVAVKPKAFSEDDMEQCKPRRACIDIEEEASKVECVSMASNSTPMGAADRSTSIDREGQHEVMGEDVLLEENAESKSVAVAEPAAAAESAVQKQLDDINTGMDDLDLLSAASTMMFHSVGLLDDQISCYSSASEISLPSSVIFF